jgi:methionyl aminopeptidase
MTRVSKRAAYVVHNTQAIHGIREAAQATARVLRRLSTSVMPGMTTLQIDELASALIHDQGGTSAFHNYHGFPGQVCISLNDEVVHGIGSPERVVAPGDLVSLDVGVRLNGFLGDSAVTFVAGGEAHADPEARRLIQITEAGLEAGIAAARGGAHVGDIGRAVEAVVSRAGFAVVRDFVGHGCGRDLHEPPEVPNFAGPARGVRLRPGMVLAIEPMVNAGKAGVMVESDGWTVRTADGTLSAHVEHMVLITDDEPEVLTWRKTA